MQFLKRNIVTLQNRFLTPNEEILAQAVAALQREIESLSAEIERLKAGMLTLSRRGNGAH
jgi:uncharacterized small protein (DUF1192 family)